MPWNSTTQKITGAVGLADIKTAVYYDSLDLGTLIKNGVINLFAKYKPVRWASPATPNDSYRSAMRWGNYLNATINRSESYQDPYWKYNRPRGLETYGEYYRALDFQNYNRAAEAPMLATNIPLQNNGQIHIDLSTIINTSANVEIQLTDLFDFPDQDYVGFVLWDVTKKMGYYCVTDVHLEELFNGIPSTSWHDFNKNIVELPFDDDDIVEFFWCTNTTNTIVHDQGGDYPDFVKITQGNSATIGLMACDATHGHTTFNIVKFNLREDIDFVNHDTVISGTWNANRTQWTLNGFSTYMQCTYGWPRSASGESYQVSWRMRVDNGYSDLFTKTQYLSSSNATQWYYLTMSNGSKTYTSQELEENDYIIELDLYGKFTDDSSWILFSTIRYDVQNDQVISYT